MKAAKPNPADASSHRKQPVRNTRTNPPRSSLLAGRPGAVEQPLPPRPAGNQPIDIYPAITHFADSITALPKELVRHFTLLKEVDAKIYIPQEQLFKLVSAATSSSIPESRPNNDASSTAAPTSAPMSTQGSSAGYAADQAIPPPPSVGELTTASSAVFDPSNIPRRQLFRQTAFKIQELLVSLEEKNHVISTANDALQRQLARVEDVWPELENEFSDEAKWGNLNHWAYPENRNGRGHQEALRRNGAAAISAAAQALADEAAARSDARKQALQAKRSLKNSHPGSDMDDHDNRTTKKSQKGRRAADGDIGLGVSSAQPQKRRKVEKPVNGGTAMERSVSAASKAKTGSPRGTPAPEPKKRKALPGAGAQGRKKYVIVSWLILTIRLTTGSFSRNGLHAKTPSATSSPVLGVYPEPKGRASPVQTSAPRPASSRARQNSMDSTKGKPSAASLNGNGTGAAAEAPATNGNDAKPKDVAGSAKADSTKKDTEKNDTNTNNTSGRRESRTEDADKDEILASIPMVTTKSGRASKPSTPALATFQEAALARSSRSRDGAGTRKTKKALANAQALAQATDDDATSSMQGDDEDGDIDADEPRYCYCNGVSYGEMVACDSDDCEREWFHLACVGLKVAPGSKSKFLRSFQTAVWKIMLIRPQRNGIARTAKSASNLEARRQAADRRKPVDVELLFGFSQLTQNMWIYVLVFIWYNM